MPKDRKGDGARDNDCVRVAVRCRPLNSTEIKQGHHSIVKMDRRMGTVEVRNDSASRGEPPKNYTFDLCFPPDSKQVDIYNETARPIVDAVIEGFNGTIFAYGQTGTGKTFTMEGDRAVPELRGIIPNSFAHIFGHISKSSGDTTFLVRCSYLEIYCEDVRDLLGANQKKKLQVKERPDVGVYVKDLSAFVVRNADDMDKIMSKGNVNRMTGETKMNARSSRSHAIFTIMIERSEKAPDGSDALRMGKLNLVDLAGSERQSKTGAEGQRLHEATKINLSLSTLGNVISSLVDGKSTHIPYRDSKLTRLLQDSLGGNAKTVMIANFGPANYNYEETISTLRYANRAKQIKNKPKINENPKDALLREFQKQIEELRAQLENGGAVDDGESGSTEEDSSGDEQVGWDGTKKKKKGRRVKKVVKRVVSPTKMAAMQEEIDKEKRQLLEKKEMSTEEKQRIAQELADREQTLEKARQQREQLESKMQAINSKVIVGGVNLLEKAEEQERLLEAAQAELEERQRAEDALMRQIQDRDEEVIEIEKQYESLQEAAADKTKKLKKVWGLFRSYTAEIEDLNQERQQQTEDLLDNIRELSRELRLYMTIIDHFIPPEYQDAIEEQAVWNEDIGEWQIPGIAYTGNNMRKTAEHLQGNPDSEAPESQLVSLDKQYFVYGSMADGSKPAKAARPKTAAGRKGSGGGRPKTAAKAKRPATAKAR